MIWSILMMVTGIMAQIFSIYFVIEGDWNKAILMQGIASTTFSCKVALKGDKYK